jgi:hypothetical protein
VNTQIPLAVGTEAMDWTKDTEDFAPHISNLRDIYITDTSLDDWNQYLGFVRGGASLRFFRGDEECELPTSVQQIYEMHTELMTLLTFDPEGMCLHCHFFAESEIEMDIDPRVFGALREIERLSEFLAGLGTVLGKAVQVTHENQPHLVIWRYEPTEDQWIHWSELEKGHRVSFRT